MAFDFEAVAAPFRMQPGLRRVAAGAQQLTPVDPDSEYLKAKCAVLAHHPSDALLAAPGFDAGPALRGLMQAATDEHPDSFEWDGAGRFGARRLGWEVRGTSVHGQGPAALGALLQDLPADWRLTALLALSLAEDLAVIDGDSATIPWLAVCIPSRWAPEEKVGRHFAEVHRPVADNRLLLQASDHLARLVTGSTRWERHVWTVSPSAGLMQHPRHAPEERWPPAPDASALAAQATFRTEHQTFIPLGTARQAIFTILVERSPLVAAIDTLERARQLHAALASMSAAVLAYRGLTDARDRLLAWLDTVA